MFYGPQAIEHGPWNMSHGQCIMLYDPQVLFYVNTIKDVLEKFFEVKITSINTCNLPRKKRRLGKFKGYKTQYKKVIITLDPKDNIQLFSDI